jgi:hypothetical protein
MALTPAKSFLPGFRLQDGTDINEQLVDKLNSIINGAPAEVTAEDVLFPVNAGVTARAGGGQANATQLTGNIATVTTVATAADSVKLPLGRAGAVFAMWNTTATSMTVYGAGTDTINGIATATGVAQAGGTKAVYFCTSDAPAASWFRVLSA